MVIVGIGCDLTEIYRVKKALTIEKFAARVFSPAEQEYCEARGMQKFASYAARFAAKEALLKALNAALALPHGRRAAHYVDRFHFHIKSLFHSLPDLKFVGLGMDIKSHLLRLILEQRRLFRQQGLEQNVRRFHLKPPSWQNAPAQTPRPLPEAQAACA